MHATGAVSPKNHPLGWEKTLYVFGDDPLLGGSEYDLINGLGPPGHPVPYLAAGFDVTDESGAVIFFGGMASERALIRTAGNGDIVEWNFYTEWNSIAMEDYGHYDLVHIETMRWHADLEPPEYWYGERDSAQYLYITTPSWEVENWAYADRCGAPGEWFRYATTPVVSPVPAPSALILLGTGLAGLVGFRTRQKRRGEDTA